MFLAWGICRFHNRKKPPPMASQATMVTGLKRVSPRPDRNVFVSGSLFRLVRVFTFTSREFLTAQIPKNNVGNAEIDHKQIKDIGQAGTEGEYKSISESELQGPLYGGDHE